MSERQDRDQLWSVLFGRTTMTIEQARELLARQRADALVDEAEQAAHGVRHLTVEHGDPESADDEQRLHHLWLWASDNRARAQISTSGGNDTTSWSVDGPDADTLIAELAALASRLNPGWWRIRPSAR
jgi:hypothetical protein